MKTGIKQYRIINSSTGNAIYYYTLSEQLDAEAQSAELERIKAHVATQNGVFVDTIYWEEVKTEEPGGEN